MDPSYTRRLGVTRAERYQAAWAMEYKRIMDAASHRERLIQHQGRLGFYNVAGPTLRSPASRGTLVETEGFAAGLGHYMAYFIQGPRAVLYDPAAPNSQFGPADVEEMVSRVSARLGMPVELWPYHHQVGNVAPHDDTWCQSWSAAFLDNTMRSWLPDDNDLSYDEAKRLMLRIVSTFCGRMSRSRDSDVAAVGDGFRRFSFPRRFHWFYDDRV